MFSELNNSFMVEYERYLRDIRGNNQNTSNKSLKFIKHILNKAVEEGLIKENLCNKFKLKRKEGKREKLSLNEVDILSKLLNSGKLKPNKENVLRYFLFCCYTGLRYSDIRTLKYKDIVNDIISIRMHKTEEYVRIPLIEKAKILMPKNSYFSNQNIFKVLTDQPTNRYLKEIMTTASINKYISFYYSRHTFATTGAELGIPFEAIKEFLGHSNMQTTMIYAKLTDKLKIKEMGKWDQLEY